MKLAEALPQTYQVKPHVLHALGLIARIEADASSSYADLCMRIAPNVAKSYTVTGEEHIPSSGPLIVVRNHPCHFDSMLLGTVFAVRPDVRPLMKMSPYTEGLPSDKVVFLRKVGPHAMPEDVAAMQQYLRAGGSMLAVPWGSMDHQAQDYANPARAAKNALRYASFGQAAVLPVTIDVERFADGTSFPVEHAEVNIHPAIMPTAEGLDEAAITARVTEMYESYAY